jgi:hypothetical protein
MSVQQYAQPSSSGPAEPAATSTTVHPTGGGLPAWRIALRHGVAVTVERSIGECLAPTPTVGLLVLAAIIALLAVIAVTLSVGNALIVLLAGVIMRITCETRR